MYILGRPQARHLTHIDRQSRESLNSEQRPYETAVITCALLGRHAMGRCGAVLKVGVRVQGSRPISAGLHQRGSPNICACLPSGLSSCMLLSMRKKVLLTTPSLSCIWGGREGSGGVDHEGKGRMPCLLCPGVSQGQAWLLLQHSGSGIIEGQASSRLQLHCRE